MRHCQRLIVNALTVKNDDDHGREIDHNEQLLSTLEPLQQDYPRRVNDLAEWQKIPGLMREENMAMSERVTGLNGSAISRNDKGLIWRCIQ
jgi:hypothetical protein